MSWAITDWSEINCALALNQIGKLEENIRETEADSRAVSQTSH